MSQVGNVIKVQFGTLPLQQKLEIKHLGPHQPEDFNIIQSGKDKNCSFSPERFKRKTWLTVSVAKNTLLLSLPALAMLSLEFIHGLVDFERKVFDKFAQMKDRRASFLFEQ